MACCLPSFPLDLDPSSYPSANHCNLLRPCCAARIPGTDLADGSLHDMGVVDASARLIAQQQVNPLPFDVVLCTMDANGKLQCGEVQIARSHMALVL